MVRAFLMRNNKITVYLFIGSIVLTVRSADLFVAQWLEHSSCPGSIPGMSHSESDITRSNKFIQSTKLNGVDGKPSDVGHSSSWSDQKHQQQVGPVY